ncbi:MAG: molecular chaperone DnaK [Planctomycetota bacterium]
MERSQQQPHAQLHAEPHAQSHARTDENALGPIVGIDLGTTNSLVAILTESGPRVLGTTPHGDIVPSVVRYTVEGSGVRAEAVGRDARAAQSLYPSRTIASAKRLLGRSAAETRTFSLGFSLPLAEGPRGIAALEVDGVIVTPQQVAADVLRELRRIAELDLGCAVRRAVITVPAYFDDAQRQATRDAARLAGLEAVRIVNEPTAAALAYGLGQTRRSERIAVYDLGGGTFDVTILDIVPGESIGSGADCFQVLATAGDTALGGDDIDRAIVGLWIASGRVAPTTAAERAELVAAAERAKVALLDRASVVERALCGGRDVELALTADELASAAQPFVERTLAACRHALKDAQTTVGEIDRVVLVGGSTRLAAVRAAVGRFFEKEPYAALDPDRVVALGAAVQAAIVGGNRKDLLLLDVIPLSLGIETIGGAMAKLIMRNSPIPSKAHEHFSTSKDGQTNVRIHVLQGERELAQHCRSLGMFDLRGIPPMPAGIPQIDVAFTVDQNGVLSVRAIEKRSGREASIQVVPSYGLSAEEVERMERESVEHARDDMTVHRVIDLRVHSELDLKWIQEALARVRLALEPSYVAELETAMSEVRGLCEAAARDPRSVDANKFHQAKQALDVLSMRVHEVSITESLRKS